MKSRFTAVIVLTALLVGAAMVRVPAQQTPLVDPALFADMRWRNIGPFRAGRTKAAAGHPSHPVKLTVNGKSYTQPITVKPDPRVKTPAVWMQQIYTVSKAAYYRALDVQSAASEARRLRDRIAAVRPQATGAVADALAALDNKIDALEPRATAAEGRGGRGRGVAAAVQQGERGGRGAAMPADTLSGASAQLAGVMNLLQGADVRPTAVQLSAIAAARANASRVRAKWTAIKTTDVARVNASLKAAGLSPVTP